MGKKLVIGTLAALLAGGVAAYSLTGTPEPKASHRVSYVTVVDATSKDGYVHPFTAQVVEKWKPDTECCLQPADTVEVTLQKGRSTGHIEYPPLSDVSEVFAIYDKSKKPEQTTLRIGFRRGGICGTDMKRAPCDQRDVQAVQSLTDLALQEAEIRRGFQFDDRYVTPTLSGTIRPILPGSTLEGTKGYLQHGAGTFLHKPE